MWIILHKILIFKVHCYGSLTVWPLQSSYCSLILPWGVRRWKVHISSGCWEVGPLGCGLLAFQEGGQRVAYLCASCLSLCDALHTSGHYQEEGHQMQPFNKPLCFVTFPIHSMSNRKWTNTSTMIKEMQGAIAGWTKSRRALAHCLALPRHQCRYRRREEETGKLEVLTVHSFIHSFKR